MSRTDNSIRNIKFALIFQMATIVVSFFTRKAFVLVLTKEYLGLDGTFSSILSILSLAEFGIGTAITFSLYKPLAKGDQDQIASLMVLHRVAYRVVGIAVAVLGAALAPFLPELIREMPDIPHIYLIYLLFVADSALTYFLAYKQSLIIADQKQYIVTAWQNGLDMMLAAAQAVFLLLTQNYFVYLGLRIGVTLLKNILLSWQANRLYPFLKTARVENLDRDTKQEITRNIKALFGHNLGGIIVFGKDNLLIAYFMGLATVGLYANYLMVINGLKTVYEQVFRAITASVGNLGASEDPQMAISVFWNINFFVCWLFGFSFICLAVLFQPFIALWVGDGYLFGQDVVWLIALNFYVWGMRKAVLVFRSAYGLYWHDRYKPFAECLIGLVASIALAPQFGVAGILAGTVISTMTTCFWIEPMMLFKHALHASPKRYFRDYVINTIVTFLTLCAVWAICALLPSVGWAAFVAKLAVCAVVGNGGFLIAYWRRKEFRYFVQLVRSRFDRFTRGRSA